MRPAAVRQRTGQRRSPDGRIDIPEVTLIAVTSLAIPATLRALHQSMRHIRFGATRLLTDQPAAAAGSRDGIDWIAIPPMASRAHYSRFMLRDLHRHVATPHALIVQWDGYVLNAGAWDDAFLTYDYIGAPWPQFDDGMTVGNGGFSLRSSALLAASAMLPDGPEQGEAEDIVIARRCRHILESDHGLRFAPEDVARAFAFERLPATGGEFGFHGVFNMPALLDDVEFRSLYAALEPGLVGWREQRDLIEIAIARRSLPLLAGVLRPHFGRAAGIGHGLRLLIAGIAAFIRARRKPGRLS